MKQKFTSLAFIPFLFCILNTHFLYTQFGNIKINNSGNNNFPEEVCIAINPINPQNIVIGANLDYYFVTFDGGKSWLEDKLGSTYGIWGDPCLVYNSKGELFYSHLSNPPNQMGHWIDRIVVQKSKDDGITWDAGVGIGYKPVKQQDKEWLAIDVTTSDYHNYIYAAWTEFDEYNSNKPGDSSRILFSYSNDNGSYWSEPLKISDIGGDCLDGNNTVMYAMPAVGVNGEVYVVWSGPMGFMMDKSTDGGKTFGKDLVISDIPGGFNFFVPGIKRVYGFPIICCDTGNSKFRGNLYIMWSDQRNGKDNTDIFFKKSSDGGNTWSQMKRVNDDTTRTHQFFPWMCIDRSTGFIYAVFYDRRHTQGTSTEVWGARSTDGGETFTNFKISESQFIANANIFIGDYISIAANDGIVYPVWSRIDNGILSIWTALIDDSEFTGIERTNHEIESIILEQCYPNPFDRYTVIRYKIPMSTRVKLTMYNERGQIVSLLTDEYKATGSYSAVFDASGLSPGVYFCKLEAGGTIQMKICVYAK